MTVPMSELSFISAKLTMKATVRWIRKKVMGKISTSIQSQIFNHLIVDPMLCKRFIYRRI